MIQALAVSSDQSHKNTSKSMMRKKNPARNATRFLPSALQCLTAMPTLLLLCMHVKAPRAVRLIAKNMGREIKGRLLKRVRLIGSQRKGECEKNAKNQERSLPNTQIHSTCATLQRQACQKSNQLTLESLSSWTCPSSTLRPERHDRVRRVTSRTNTSK